ncbi:MAG: hypothetical protein EOP86_04080 [Verrucomicrobiaceae bacterium]|nr:MAG: hypothetical protein EOP86_04080 [Verrucomicrobiaceae bacterium]
MNGRSGLRMTRLAGRDPGPYPTHSRPGIASRKPDESRGLANGSHLTGLFPVRGDLTEINAPESGKLVPEQKWTTQSAVMAP